MLRLTSGPEAGRSIEVESELVIGREDADVTIADSEISRRHLAVRPAGDGLEVEDLGSLNGTMVNGRRISEPVTLTAPGTIQLGTTKIQVDLAPPAPPEPAADPNATVARPVPPPADPAVTAPRAIPTAEEPGVTAQRPVTPPEEPAVTAQRPVPPAEPPPGAGAGAPPGRPEPPPPRYGGSSTERPGGGGPPGGPPKAVLAGAGLIVLVVVVLLILLLAG